MSSPALHWFGGDERRRLGSRGTAGLLAIALNVGFLYLLAVAFRLIPAPESPTVESMTRLIDQPRGQYRAADLRALSIHLNRPALRMPDTPPNIPIDVPVETPMVQQRSAIHAPLPPGTTEQPGAASSHGRTEEPGVGEAAALVHEVGPVYGAASVQSHEQGVVALRVLVDEHGRATQVHLAESSGFPRLDQSAINAAKRYRFTPQVEGPGQGQSWMTVKLEFDLLPLPVPTTVVGFDSVVAKQIANAKRVDRGGVYRAMLLLRRLADDLMDSASRRRARELAVHKAHSPPTPLQMLVSQGRATSVRFVGYATQGFDCGTANLPANSGYSRCGIFKVEQVHGASYWLAAMTYEGAVKSVAVAVAPALR